MLSFLVHCIAQQKCAYILNSFGAIYRNMLHSPKDAKKGKIFLAEVRTLLLQSNMLLELLLLTVLLLPSLDTFSLTLLYVRHQQF